jgi:hypothetical protein
MRFRRTFITSDNLLRFIAIVTLFLTCGLSSAQSLTPTTTEQPKNQSLADYSASSPSDWHFEPTISGGYSNVHFNGNNAIPYNPQGGYIDANVYARMPNYESPIIGLGISATGNWDDYTIPYPTAPFSKSFYANTDMVCAEVRVAFPFGFSSPTHGLYFLPRLGIGALTTGIPTITSEPIPITPAMPSRFAPTLNSATASTASTSAAKPPTWPPGEISASSETSPRKSVSAWSSAIATNLSSRTA